MLNVKELQEKPAKELILMLVNSNSEVEKLNKENNSLKTDVHNLTEQLKLFLARKYKRQSESSNQLELVFDEPEITKEQEQEVEQAEEEIIIPSHTRKKKQLGRKSLPKSLPRKDIIHDLSEAEKQCSCGCVKKCIGEEVTEQLEYIPAETYVNRHVRKKYACRDCEAPGIITAPMPAQPIPRSIAGPGLLAQILVAKYCYHLPLYRQEQVLQDAGVDIPRATTSSWVIKCAALLQPLVNLLQDNIISYDVSYADETSVQVLKEAGRDASKQSYMWSFAGGEPSKFSIIFKYSPTRKHDTALDFFGTDYAGYVHCDGYYGYDAMKKASKSILVGCMLHARRKFFDITKTTKQLGLSHQAVKIFGELAKIEHTIKKHNFDPVRVKKYREENSKPILDKFKLWLEKHINIVPPNSAIAQAIQYTLNQWPKLINFIKDGRLEWSNNTSERIMKMFATGRKNWLFSCSVSGAEASAIIYSLVVTCRHHKVDVFKYFRYVMKQIPLCKNVDELESLLPYNIDQRMIGA